MSSLRHQVSGRHYKDCKIQPIEYAHANGLGVCESNIVKYVTRHRLKGKADDLRKARHYIDMLLELEYGEKGKDPAHKPAAETEVPADWHEAVAEIRSGTPNSACSAIVIAPTIATPGWTDACAEALPGSEVEVWAVPGVDGRDNYWRIVDDLKAQFWTADKWETSKILTSGNIRNHAHGRRLKPSEVPAFARTP